MSVCRHNYKSACVGTMFAMARRHRTYRWLFPRAQRLLSSSAFRYLESKDDAHAWSHSLLLPKSKLPLNPNQTELAKRFNADYLQDQYDWQRQNRKGPLFILHDGPPYANGELHIGHALNRVLKDIIIRFQSMSGNRVDYVPGWDCHGLPIELKALAQLKSLGGKVQVQDPLRIRSEARNFAHQAIVKQKKSLNDWGIMGDFKAPYLTLDPDYEVMQLIIFREMVAQNLIERKFKPVYWSPSSRTALAEAELEYNENHVSVAIYVKFKLTEIPDAVAQKILAEHQTDIAKQGISLLIWTTTPWTLPANKLISVNPDLVYKVYRSENHGFIVAADVRKHDLSKLCPMIEASQPILGSELKGLSYSSPLHSYTGRVYESNFVTDDVGTGLVHNAPSHGFEDYILAKEIDMPIDSVIDEAGRYMRDALQGQLEGANVLGDGQTRVIDLLNDAGAVFHTSEYEHRYPYDWRTKKPVIVRATEQWFANLGPFREKALKRIPMMDFIPATGNIRLSSNVQSRYEWCISRQRCWGVPIPALYNEYGEAVMTPESIDHIIDVIRKRGTDAWWSDPPDDQSWICESLKQKYPKLHRCFDTMDVWFDSGSSWNVMLSKNRFRDDQIALSDVYLEGSDQHRGWFQSSLLLFSSVMPDDKLPFQKLITHGFALDQQGYKMSKSLGNVVDPKSVMEKSDRKFIGGPDLLRLWAASCDYTKDFSIGPDILSTVLNHLKKLRFSFRFLVANLSEFDMSKRVSTDSYSLLDFFILHKLVQFDKSSAASYSTYRFNRVYSEVNDFIFGPLAFYLGAVKDTLYADSKFSESRRAVQTVFQDIIEVLLRKIAPIVPHLSEEVYSCYKSTLASDTRDEVTGPESSLFAQAPYQISHYDAVIPEKLVQLSDPFSKIKDTALKALQQARDERQIGSSLEAAVILEGRGAAVNDLLEYYASEWWRVLNVAHVEISSSSADSQSDAILSVQEAAILGGSVKVNVQRAQKSKCPRCWNFRSERPGSLCSRCEAVIDDLSKTGPYENASR